MTWRLMCTAVLLTLAAGCDRGNSPIGPSPFQLGGPAFVSGGPSFSILIISGGSLLTTTVFPATPLTVPRGSTVSCIDNNNTAQPGTIAGTVNSGIFAPGGSTPVTLRDAGTFTFGCALQPTISLTIIVV